MESLGDDYSPSSSLNILLNCLVSTKKYYKIEATSQLLFDFIYFVCLLHGKIISRIHFTSCNELNQFESSEFDQKLFRRTRENGLHGSFLVLNNTKQFTKHICMYFILETIKNQLYSSKIT
jgi:hypothetical protein